MSKSYISFSIPPEAIRFCLPFGSCVWQQTKKNCRGHILVMYGILVKFNFSQGHYPARHPIANFQALIKLIKIDSWRNQN